MGGATAGGVTVENIDGGGDDSTKVADGGGAGTGAETDQGTGTVDVGSEGVENSSVNTEEEGGVNNVSATEVVTDSSVSGGDVEVDSDLVLDVSDDTDLDNKG